MMKPPAVWNGKRPETIIELMTLTPRQRVTDLQLDHAARHVCGRTKHSFRSTLPYGVDRNAMLQSLSEGWRIENEKKAA
jgi:hypothetical protein